MEGFKECVRFELARERIYRYEEPSVEEHTLLAGADPSTQILYSYRESFRGGLRTVFSTARRDKDFFHTVIIDDDEDPGSYVYEHRPKRPLIVGNYEVRFDFQRPVHQPCDADIKSINHYEVTVTAPAGTLHEAFFDPVSVGTAVGADAANGKLEPRAFEVDGESTEITSLEWNDGRVALVLGAWVSLSGYVLEFIALDGSVSLSLPVEEATLDEEAGAYTWEVLTQPWVEGDLLMLRVREG